MTLNEQACQLADAMEADARRLRVAVSRVGGARLIDCGVQVPGGLEAGLALARVCLAGRAEVALTPEVDGPVVSVRSDDPVMACLGSQYAGWQVSVGKYFAMGSGPMRAAYGKEAVCQHIGAHERPPVAVGVLEAGKLPTEEVVAHLAGKLELPPDRLTLLCAPTTSIAGTIQVVARSLETALHKLHELGFDLSTVLSGHGVAPLPPAGADTISAIGRTNDAILYGGHVTLWVRAEDAAIQEVGPRVPSSASQDHGEPFQLIFERYGRDFYKVDPMLFSPAVIRFDNLKTGHCHVFGQIDPAVLARSFLGG